MNATTRIPDSLRLFAAQAAGKEGMALARTDNGVELCLPAFMVDMINKDEALQEKVDALGEMVADVEERTGKQFDRPVFLTAAPSNLAFATGMATEENLREMFGDYADELSKGKTEQEMAEYHTLLHIPLMALMPDSHLTMEDIEGIVLHELGHAATKNELQQKSEVMLWRESLAKIDNMCMLVQQLPEMTEDITKPMGGNDAYLEQAVRLFGRVDKLLGAIMTEASSDGKTISSEDILDKLGEPAFCKKFDELAKLGTGDTLKEFDQFHDTTVHLLCESIKQGLGFVPGMASSQASAQVMQKLGMFDIVLNHSSEFTADDFATRHDPRAGDSLRKLPDSGPSESHPATGLRIKRADTLDDKRIESLVEHGQVDEQGAVKATNQTMREHKNDYLQQARERAGRNIIREIIEARENGGEIEGHAQGDSFSR